MLKITNIRINPRTIDMDVLIEGDAARAYALSVRRDGDVFPVVASGIPAEHRIYERQARTALRGYIGRRLPDEIVSEWY